MRLPARFPGQDDPFEGDRTVYIQGLPEGAQVTSARLTILPVQSNVEIVFNGGGASWGATKEVKPGGGWVAVDLHARRTVSSLLASASPGGCATVQVELGGLWVRLAGDGTIVTREDDEPLHLSLSAAPTSASIPPITVQRLKLEPAGPNLDHCTLPESVDLQQLTVVSHPSNVCARIGGMPPFWSRPGELSKSESSPDFADVLMALLADAAIEGGHYVVPLVVHSDTIASLDLEVEIEYLNQQSPLSAGVSEAALAFDYSGLPKADANLLEIALPVGARVVTGATTAQVIGAFDESRIVYGPTGEVMPVGTVPLMPDLSQAQPILLSSDQSGTAIDLLLTAETRVASLDLRILKDTDGKPSNEQALGEPVTIQLDHDVAGTPTWISAPLPTDFQFEKDTRYWLALQAREGIANWSVQAETGPGIGMHFTDSGGLAWRTTAIADGPAFLAGFFRIRNVPSRFQMPIELQVGTGDQARRVSLDRFQPLGRVDLSLDFEEVASAINEVAAASAMACPTGEHLANGTFDEWAGDALLPALSLETGTNSPPVAVATDCRWIFVGGGQRGDSVDLENPFFHAIDPTCREVTLKARIDLIPRRIVVDPDGRRSIVAGDMGSSNYWFVKIINLQTGQASIGSLNLQCDINTLVGLALSPNGQQLYVSGYVCTEGCSAEILVLDCTELAQTLIIGDVSLSDINFDVISIEPPPGNENASYVHGDITLSVDGSRLYVATVRDGTVGELHVVDTVTRSAVGALVEVGQSLRRIALTPSGDRVVIVGTETTGGCMSVTTGHVYLVDTATGAVTTVPAHADFGAVENPTAIAIAPDGSRAFITDAGANAMLVVDIARRAFVQQIALDASPWDVAVTPLGNWIVVPVADGETIHRLTLIPVGVQLPVEWTLTSGAIIPACLREPSQRLAVLGLSPLEPPLSRRTSSLSQVVPASAPCTYEFAFWGLSTDTGATAEVIWLGDVCNVLGAETVPIRSIPAGQFGGSRSSDCGFLFAALAVGHAELVLHRTRFDAPAGATQAEIRFSTPAGVVAAIDLVSFKGTVDAVVNGDLRAELDGQLADWTFAPATAAAAAILTDGKAVQLQNSGREAVVLAQQFAVTEGQPFTTSFEGHVVASSTDERPRIEVDWSDVDGSPVGSTVLLTLQLGGTDHIVGGGAVPPAAIEAEMRLVVPGATTLEVKRVLFRTVEVVKIPLTFIAQAPGELTISDLRIATDQVEDRLPAIPETGLCPPTPPGRRRGSGPDDCCFCLCCGAEKQLREPQPTMTRANRPALAGSCPDCGSSIVRGGGRPVRAGLPTRARSAQLPMVRVAASPARLGPAVGASSLRRRASLTVPEHAREADGEPVATQDRVEELPLTAVKGVGPARFDRLIEIGIDSIEELAAASGELVARALANNSLKVANDLIKAAGQLLEEQKGDSRG